VDGIDTSRYWEDRLAREYSLDGVGWMGLGRAYNAWMYRVRARVFRRVVRRHVPLPDGARVLDVGSGTGFYLDQWRALGAGPGLEGSDLTETATAQLRQRLPDVTIHQFDAAGDPALAPSGPFDAISGMDVLFHIVDDDGFRRALQTLADRLAPEGRLVWSDNFLRGEEVRAPHQASRTEAAILDALAAAGLQPVTTHPMFVLMNSPVDSRSRLLGLWWSLLTRVAARGDRLGSVAGALLYGPELLLTRLVRRGPSTKIMVCRRA
jgi:SAM-dependent methyltransferase